VRGFVEAAWVVVVQRFASEEEVLESGRVVALELAWVAA